MPVIRKQEALRKSSCLGVLKLDELRCFRLQSGVYTHKIYTPGGKHGTWKLAPGRVDSYWKPSFSGSMLNFYLGGVTWIHPPKLRWNPKNGLFFWMFFRFPMGHSQVPCYTFRLHVPIIIRFERNYLFPTTIFGLNLENPPGLYAKLRSMVCCAEMFSSILYRIEGGFLRRTHPRPRCRRVESLRSTILQSICKFWYGSSLINVFY